MLEVGSTCVVDGAAIAGEPLREVAILVGGGHVCGRWGALN